MKQGVHYLKAGVGPAKKNRRRAQVKKKGWNLGKKIKRGN
jgi:hypothetical protein